MSKDSANQVRMIADHFNAIRGLLRRRSLSDMAGSSLTVQQINVIKELSVKDGQTISQLGDRMALVHSTVSGIVDRLEQKGLIYRQSDPKDKRYMRVYLGKHVLEYLSYHVPSRRADLMLGALERAKPTERSRILEGLRTLQRLLVEELEAGSTQDAGSS